MPSSDVCSTKGAVNAFLEYLVDPKLPAKASIRDNPPPSLQQSVAKQVHSAVLLYNYYYRKQHPELAFLAWDEFCKLAVDLRPPLLAHMKSIDETGLVDVEKQLSLTEEKVKNACDICTCLDASKNVPNIEGWPISKVAVLLVDSKKENCFLVMNSSTEGVWSVVEKDADTPIRTPIQTPNQCSEVTSGSKTYKKKRVIRKPIKFELNAADEDGFLQVGYSAVKEAAGVNKTDLVLLGSHTVYSHSKEKTASRFYVMKCSQLINQEAIEFQHTIKDLIERETFSNSLQDSKPAEKNLMASCSEVTESCISSEGMSIGLDNKPSSDTIEDQKENNESCIVAWSGSIKEKQDMDMDISLLSPSKDKEECQHPANSFLVSEDQEIEIPSVQHDSNQSKSPIKVENVDSTMMLITDGGIKDQSTCEKICAKTSFENDSTEECTLNMKDSNSDLEKLQVLVASKGKQTALNAIIGKRNALALQQRMIEDEIALCEQKIHRILTSGADELALMIESIIEGCNDTWVRNEKRACRDLEDQCSPPCIKRRRLREAVLILQNPCEELDGICHENNWLLPIYHSSESDGGYRANVTVKGVEFESCCRGEVCSNPGEARESAAAKMLMTLRSMAKPHK